MSRVVLIALLAACSGKSDDAPPPPPVVPADAAVIDGITTIDDFDPASGAHLDDDAPTGRTPKKPARQGPAIGILLKSEPPGATVYVDGQSLGVTPKYWNGVADGTEHEFSFTLAKYGLARYRFVPISSGTLHATLERVAGGETIDAGLDPVIAPTFAPDAALPPPDAAVAPPPTVLSPVDAAVPTTPSPAVDATQKPAPSSGELITPGPTP